MTRKQKLNALKQFLKVISNDFKGLKWIDCASQSAVAEPYKEAFICNSMCIIAFVADHFLEAKELLENNSDEYWLIYYNNAYFGIKPSRVVDWYMCKAQKEFPYIPISKFKK